MSLKKNLYYNFLLSASQLLFPLVSIPYISRVLEADGIGKVNLTDSLTYFIVVIAELGLPTFAVREIAKVQQSKNSLINRTNELISLHIISTLFVSIIFAVGVFFQWGKIHSTTMILFSILFFFSNIFNCEWYYWGTERFSYIAIRSIFTRLAGLAFIFLLIKTPQDFEKYYAIIVCSMLGNIVLNAFSIFPSFRFNFSKIKEDFKKCLPIYFIGLIYSVMLMLDNVILGFTSTFTAVAFYANAVKIVRISGALITDSFHVFFPRTTSLINENKQEELIRVIEKSIQIIFIFSIPLCFGLAIFSKLFTSVYFGNFLLPIYKNLIILSFYPIIKSFSLFFSRQILLSYHQDKVVLKGYIFGGLFFVISCIVLSYYFNDNGCSISLILSEFFIMLYFFFASKKYLVNINYHFFYQLVLALLTFILFYSIDYCLAFFKFNYLYTLLISIFSCMFFYGLLLIISKNKFAFEIIELLKNKINY